MRAYVTVSKIVVAGFVLVALATSPVARAANGQSGQMQQGMSGMQHGGMQPAMSPADQMMRDLGTMMGGLTTMMRDFRTAHEAMMGPSHDQLMGSMQGMLDQMRQFHASMNGMAKNEELMRNADAMKTFQQAGRDFQQMGKSFEAMLKNMDKVMKGIHRDPSK